MVAVNIQHIIVVYSDFSERVLFRTVFISKGFYFERSFLRTVFSPLIRKVIAPKILIPKCHCSERFLIRKIFYSERFLSRTVFDPNDFNSERSFLRNSE